MGFFCFLGKDYIKEEEIYNFLGLIKIEFICFG